MSKNKLKNFDAAMADLQDTYEAVSTGTMLKDTCDGVNKTYHNMIKLATQKHAYDKQMGIVDKIELFSR